MQRARVTEGWYHKASRAIDVRVLTFHFSLVSGKRRRGLRIGYLCSICVRHRELVRVVTESVPFNFKHRDIFKPSNFLFKIMDDCVHFDNCCLECLDLLLKKTTPWLHNVMSVTA